jgi:hypothetical protein
VVVVWSVVECGGVWWSVVGWSSVCMYVCVCGVKWSEVEQSGATSQSFARARTGKGRRTRG